MFRVKTETWTGVVNIHFTTSLLDWATAPSRFFKMLHEVLPSNFTDDPGNFSVTTGNTLDEVSAKYTILGGSDTIVLSAKTLSMEFRELSRDMLEYVIPLIQDVETSFVTHFPECGYQRFEVLTLEHLSFCDEQSASDFLSRFAISSMEEAFHGCDVVNNPSARFNVVDKESKWAVHCFVEKSHVLTNGLFLQVRATLLEVNSGDHFQEKRDRIDQIANACVRALQLEQDNG